MVPPFLQGFISQFQHLLYALWCLCVVIESISDEDAMVGFTELFEDLGQFDEKRLARP